MKYFRSRDLAIERARHPASKYVGNKYGLNVWGRINFEYLDYAPKNNISRTWSPASWSKEQQIDDLKHINDDEFNTLVSILGRSHILDCLHIWTAHRGDCLAFLTVDAKLLRHFENSAKCGRLDWLKARPQLPSQLAKQWKIRPVPIEHLAPLSASFPYIVR